MASTSQSIPAAGGNGSISVTVGATCAWTAVSNATWLTVTAGTSGIGNGTVAFIAAATNSSSPRSGTITIGGSDFTVNQDATCSYSVAPASQSIDVGGGNGTMTVTAGTGCGWAVVSNAVWITVTSPIIGSGNGTIAFTVSPDNGAPRSGTISVGGQTATVTQSGCSGSVSPTSIDVDFHATTGTLTVWTTSSCIWTASTSASWVTIGPTGIGPGQISYSLLANPGTARTATILIAGQQISVTQESANAPAAPKGLRIKKNGQ
jgi:hypothetical protein